MTAAHAMEDDQESLGQLFVEQTAGAVVVVDAGGIVVSWNEGAEALYGYHEEEMLGRALASLAAPATATGSNETSGTQGGRLVRRQHKDGSLVSVLAERRLVPTFRLPELSADPSLGPASSDSSDTSLPRAVLEELPGSTPVSRTGWLWCDHAAWAVS